MLFSEIKHFQNLARHNFEEHGELVPVMFGLYKKPNGEISRKIIGLVFNNPEDKDALTQFLCNEIKHNNLKEYLLILESWISEFRDGSADKSECVIMIYSGNGREKVYMSKISRCPDTLHDWKECNTKTMEGRFIGLYKRAVAEWN